MFLELTKTEVDESSVSPSYHSGPAVAPAAVGRFTLCAHIRFANVNAHTSSGEPDFAVSTINWPSCTSIKSCALSLLVFG